MLDSNQLERSHSEDRQGNWTRRTRYSLDQALRREKAAALNGYSAPFELFEAWRENTKAPSILNQTAFSDETRPWFAQVDVTNWSPWQFSYRRHMSSPYGHFLGACLGETTANHPFPSHVKSAMLEYYRCKLEMQPTYFEIEQAVNGIYRAYTRMMIPVPGQQGDATDVVYAIRYTAEPSSVPE